MPEKTSNENEYRVPVTTDDWMFASYDVVVFDKEIDTDRKDDKEEQIKVGEHAKSVSPLSVDLGVTVHVIAAEDGGMKNPVTVEGDLDK